MKDSHSRSILKALLWRCVASGTTIIIVYLYTRELTLSLGVGALDVLLKLVFYYLHERMWNKIKWGKK